MVADKSSTGYLNLVAVAARLLLLVWIEVCEWVTIPLKRNSPHKSHHISNSTLIRVILLIDDDSCGSRDVSISITN